MYTSGRAKLVKEPVDPAVEGLEEALHELAGLLLGVYGLWLRWPALGSGLDVAWR